MSFVAADWSIDRQTENIRYIVINRRCWFNLLYATVIELQPGASRLP